MLMTLKDASYCLSEKPNGCANCKFDKQAEIDCRREALKMGEDAINTLIKYQSDFKKIFGIEDENEELGATTIHAKG